MRPNGDTQRVDNPIPGALKSDHDTRLRKPGEEAPRRMQSLPRSQRVTKGLGKGRDLREIEGLARTNFQRIGYLSLSRGNTSCVCEGTVRTPSKHVQETNTHLSADRPLHFVKDEYITRVLALGNQQLLLGNPLKARLGASDERPLHFRRVYDKYKVVGPE